MREKPVPSKEDKEPLTIVEGSFEVCLIMASVLAMVSISILILT